MEQENQPQAEVVADAGPKRRKSDGQPKLTGKNRPKKNPNMKRSPNEAHSPKQIDVRKKQVEALEYRKMGLNYAQIGDKLGVTHQTAWNYVEGALKAIIQEPAEEVRKLELARLDAMQIQVYGNAMRGDLVALAAMLNIMNRRTKYLGMDAPVKTDNKTEVTNADGVMVIGPVMTPEEWMAAAKVQQASITSEPT